MTAVVSVFCRQTCNTHNTYCILPTFYFRFIYTVCIFKIVGFRIFAVCVEQLYKREREREIEIKREILGAILDRYECEKHNRSG